jgi:hypothetical protein
VVDPGGRHDQPLDLARPQHFDLRSLATGVVVGVDDQPAEASRFEYSFDAANDGREERIGEVRDDKSYGAGLRGLEPACDRVGPVAEGLRDVDHAPCGLGLDQLAGSGVQCAGGRGRVDAGGLGHVTKRR